METVVGAMGSLLPKLGNLLKDEYQLQTGVKKDIHYVRRELQSMEAALIKIGMVPRGQLDEQVRIWAGEVRELSYMMEDVIDTFFIHIEVPGDGKESNWLKEIVIKMQGLFSKAKNQHRIGQEIKEIKEQLLEVASRRDRNTVNVAVTKAVLVDPRIRALNTDDACLVGVEGKRDLELERLLLKGADTFINRMRIISVAGPAGLGKTTLVRMVYNRRKNEFGCSAFICVGQNPDPKKILRDILREFGGGSSDLMDDDLWQLICKVTVFLQDRRYFVVLDDIWDNELWEGLNLAFSHNNNKRSRIIITTRNSSLAQSCSSSSNDAVYRMTPLTSMESELLFYKRIFPKEGECPKNLQSVSREILRKCGGIPLAVVTIASILATEEIQPIYKWESVLQSIGHGLTDSYSVDALRKILLLSFDDMPRHIRTFLLYLSMHPEDCTIYRDQVIWKMISEGFVPTTNEGSVYEVGMSYFNELIHRNMVVPVFSESGELDGCRIHDLILELLRSLSTEMNFTCVLDSFGDAMPADRIVRRLSVQYSENHPEAAEVIQSMEVAHVRSLTVFPSSGSIVTLKPLLKRFKVLRVLDLEGCCLEQFDLKVICKLVHLRYLGLADTSVSDIPKEIHKLKLLQFLDVTDCLDLEVFPAAICQLTKLMVLTSEAIFLPKGFGNLIYLEVLRLVGFSLNSVQELVKLSRLRVLEVTFEKEEEEDYFEDYFEKGNSQHDLELKNAFAQSVCKLKNIERFVIYGPFEFLDVLGVQWGSLRRLQHFDMSNCNGVFSTLPAWLKKDPAQFSLLSMLCLYVKELEQNDICVLGSLPHLCHLELHSVEQRLQQLTIGAGEFPDLLSLELRCGPGAQIVFGEMSLPNVKHLCVDISLLAAQRNGNYPHRLLTLHRNLMSLQYGKVHIFPEGVKGMDPQQALQAGRHVIRVFEAHINRPTHDTFLVQTPRFGRPLYIEMRVEGKLGVPRDSKRHMWRKTEEDVKPEPDIEYGRSKSWNEGSLRRPKKGVIE